MTNILEIAIKRDKPGNNKYERLVSTACVTIARHFPEAVISDKGLILKAISNCYYESSNGSDFRSYIYLIQITDQNGKDKIISAIDESLDIEFNPSLYNDLIRHKIYSSEYKNYFSTYVSNVARTSGRSIQFKEGKVNYSNTDFTFFNFAMLIHNLGITLTNDQKNQFQNRSTFDQWLLDPENFNIGDFQAYWLKAIEKKSMMNKVRDIQYIHMVLKQDLTIQYDEILGKIYLKHFMRKQK